MEKNSSAIRAQIGAQVTDLKRNGKILDMRVKSSDNVDGIIMQSEKEDS